jgi:hypothetical protein
MATSDESSLIKEEGITADMTPQVCLAKTSGEALKMTDEECLASRSLGESSGMESVVKAVERAAKSALSPYKYGSGASCSGSLNKITSEADCRKAATAKGLSFKGTETSSGYPSGCYKYQSDKVYLNFHATGKAHSSSTPLCKFSNSCASGTGRAGKKKTFDSSMEETTVTPDTSVSGCRTNDYSNCFPALLPSGSTDAKMGACSDCSAYKDTLKTYSLPGDAASNSHWRCGFYTSWPVHLASGCAACPKGEEPIKIEGPSSGNPNGRVFCAPKTGTGGNSGNGGATTKKSKYCFPENSNMATQCGGPSTPRTCVYRNEATDSQFYNYNEGNSGSNYEGNYATTCQVWKVTSCKNINGVNKCGSSLKTRFVKSKKNGGSTFTKVGDLPATMQKYHMEYGMCSSIAQSYG